MRRRRSINDNQIYCKRLKWIRRIRCKFNLTSCRMWWMLLHHTVQQTRYWVSPPHHPQWPLLRHCPLCQSWEQVKLHRLNYNSWSNHTKLASNNNKNNNEEIHTVWQTRKKTRATWQMPCLVNRWKCEGGLRDINNNAKSIHTKDRSNNNNNSRSKSIYSPISMDLITITEIMVHKCIKTVFREITSIITKIINNHTIKSMTMKTRMKMKKMC